MKRSWMPLTLSVMLAGCGTQQQPDNEKAAEVAQPGENQPAPVPVAPPDIIKPGEPGGLAACPTIALHWRKARSIRTALKAPARCFSTSAVCSNRGASQRRGGYGRTTAVQAG